jgi:hypothetical protein
LIIVIRLIRAAFVLLTEIRDAAKSLLEINPRHELIRKLAARKSDEPAFCEDLAP